MNKEEFKLGIRASLPTAFGYVSIGFACGLVGASCALSPLEMGLMSLIVYGGSSQFVMCALILAHASFITIVLTVFLINLRHFLMSLHVTTIFKKQSLLTMIGIGSLLTDESYGVLLIEAAKKRPISSSWMYANNLTGYITWAIAVVFGSIFGQWIPNPEQFGFDFALIAMFVAIFMSQLEVIVRRVKSQKILSILMGVLVVYLALISFVSSSIAVLLSTIAGCVIGVMIDDN